MNHRNLAKEVAGRLGLDVELVREIIDEWTSLMAEVLEQEGLVRVLRIGRFYSQDAITHKWSDQGTVWKVPTVRFAPSNAFKNAARRRVGYPEITVPAARDNFWKFRTAGEIDGEAPENDPDGKPDAFEDGAGTDAAEACGDGPCDEAEGQDYQVETDSEPRRRGRPVGKRKSMASV